MPNQTNLYVVPEIPEFESCSKDYRDKVATLFKESYIKIIDKIYDNFYFATKNGNQQYCLEQILNDEIKAKNNPRELSILSQIFYSYNIHTKTKTNIDTVYSAKNSYNMEKSKRQDIFISYSHADEDKIYFNEVKKYLENLKPYGLDVKIWDDTQIKSGDDWYKEISKALDKTKVGILLISPNFLNSNFIKREEMPKLLENVKEGGCKIMPIILSRVLLNRHYLGQYQSVNNPNNPLNTLTEIQRGNVYTELLEDILHFYEDIPSS